MQKTHFLASLFIFAAAVPARAQSTFPDVPNDHWAAQAVRRLAEAGIIEGRPAISASDSILGNTAGNLNAYAAVAVKIKMVLVRNAAFTNVNVEVMSRVKGYAGTVTLIGSVTNKAQQTLAANIARHEAPGYAIINRLKIVAARSTRKR